MLHCSIGGLYCGLVLPAHAAAYISKRLASCGLGYFTGAALLARPRRAHPVKRPTLIPCERVFHPLSCIIKDVMLRNTGTSGLKLQRDLRGLDRSTASVGTVRRASRALSASRITRPHRSASDRKKPDGARARRKSKKHQRRPRARECLESPIINTAMSPLGQTGPDSLWKTGIGCPERTA
jgi:hypothetical protein